MINFSWSTILNLFLSGLVTAGNAVLFNDKLQSLTKELSDLEAQAEYISSEIKRVDDKVPTALDQIAEKMFTMKDILSTIPDDSNGRRDLVSTYIQSIRLQKDKKIELELKIEDPSSSKQKNGSPSGTTNRTTSILL